MAILKDSIIEDLILSKSERAVIRGVYRASQLLSAAEVMEKIESSISQSSGALRTASMEERKHINRIRDYLGRQIIDALVATKTPAVQLDKAKDQ